MPPLPNKIVQSIIASIGGPSAGGKFGGGSGSASPAAAQLRQYYIYDTEGGATFEFHAMPVNGYSVSKNVNWIPTEIPGRSSPILGYQGSNSLTFNINIPLFASIEAGDGRTPDNVQESIHFLLSLAYPDYRGGGVKPPHKCMIVMGKQFSALAVMSSISIDAEGPWDAQTGGLTIKAMVSTSWYDVSDRPHDTWEVRAGVFKG